MPFFKDEMSSGNLFIEFEVVMPLRNELKKKHIKKLKKILKGPKHVDIDYKNKDLVILGDFNPTELHPDEAGGSNFIPIPISYFNRSQEGLWNEKGERVVEQTAIL